MLRFISDARCNRESGGGVSLRFQILPLISSSGQKGRRGPASEVHASVVMLANRGRALRESLCVGCHWPFLADQGFRKSRRPPTSRRCLGNRLRMFQRRSCPDRLHNHFRQPAKCRSTFPWRQRWRRWSERSAPQQQRLRRQWTSWSCSFCHPFFHGVGLMRGLRPDAGKRYHSRASVSHICQSFRSVREVRPVISLPIVTNWALPGPNGTGERERLLQKVRRSCLA